jgi:hypothetical protein
MKEVSCHDDDGSGAHPPNHFDTLGHLGLIYLATVIFVVGALLALRGIMAEHRS